MQMKVEIVSAHKDTTFQERINSRLEADWKLYGNVFSTSVYDFNIIMTKTY